MQNVEGGAEAGQAARSVFNPRIGLRRAFNLLRDHKGLDYTIATLPAEDPPVYDMLCAADSVGVFQVESRAQMNMLPRLKPRTLYDLVIEVAIVRPGPIQGDMGTVGKLQA